MNINDEDAIALLNRLLERLHQADMKNFGSHLQIVYVSSGAQHVETQINVGKTLPNPPCVGREKEASNLPEALGTEAAMALWRKAQRAGYVDEHYQRGWASKRSGRCSKASGTVSICGVITTWLLPERKHSTFWTN